MISLLLGLYAAELAPTPAKSFMPSLTKVALVAGIALTYLTTSALADPGYECCIAYGMDCGGRCEGSGTASCNRTDYGMPECMHETYGYDCDGCP